MGLLDFFRQGRVESRSQSHNGTLAALGATWLADRNRYTADQLAVVEACRAAVSGYMMALPIHVYRADGEKEELPDHPVARLLRDGPNDFQTGPEFVEWLIGQAVTHGNGLAEVITDGRGEVTSLLPIPWGLVQVELTAPGRLRYVVAGDDLSAPVGSVRTLLPRQVIHLRARSDDGVIGVAPLKRAAAAADLAVEVDSHVRTVWRNQTTPSSVLSTEGVLDDSVIARLKASLDAWRGEGKGKAMVLESGLTFKQVDMVSPEDAEILASRRFSVEEIARAHGVPAPLIGDLTHGTFTNSATLIRQFAVGTLAQWARRFETSIARGTFTEAERRTLRLDVDLSGLLRGDAEARWQAHKVAIDAGVLGPDEVRELEGFGRREKRPPATMA